MNSTNVLVSDDTYSQEKGDIPYLHRWRFNLSTGAVTEEKLDDVPGEFPRVNEHLLGRKTQYGYVGKMADSQNPLFCGVIKYDFENSKSQTHEFGKNRYGGETVFAPHPRATTEDEGWLVTFVYDENSQRSELLVINAEDMTSEPIARVILPQRVPYGFHGTWISY
jgi:carotenoid cleavage dioxygenase